jgi:hypothetical protein
MNVSIFVPGRLQSSLRQLSPSLIFFVLASAAWMVFDNMVLAPAPGGLDIYYFKDAGINFAEGLGFVSRFTYGNPTFEYQTYSQYPPLYPLAYGLFVEIFGVSLSSNELFNSVINLTCGILGFVALRPMLGRWNNPLASAVWASLFLLSIVSGYFKPDADRPDAMAVCLALLTLQIVRTTQSAKGYAIAGALCSAIFFISPFVSIWLAVAAAVLALSRLTATGDMRRLLVSLLCATSGALLSAALILAAIFVLLPDWWNGFVGVLLGTTTRNETGGGYFRALLSGDFRGWAQAFVDFTGSGWGTLILNLGKLALATGILVVAVIYDTILRPKDWLRSNRIWMLALILSCPICVILVPYQFNYMRITSLLVLAAAASLVVAMPVQSRRIYGTAVLAAFFLINLSTLPQIIRDSSIRLTTHASLARAEAFIRTHRSDFADERGFLAVASPTYILWRQEGIRPLGMVYSGFEDPANRKRLNSLALNYFRSVDPLVPEQPGWFSPTEFHSIFDPSLPQPATLAGIKLTSGSQTWESSIFVRNENQEGQ